eukprot:7377313-Prymnesium_polylepis.2
MARVSERAPPSISTCASVPAQPPPTASRAMTTPKPTVWTPAWRMPASQEHALAMASSACAAAYALVLCVWRGL